MGVFDRKGLQAYLDLPEDQELMALIALGLPAGEGAPPTRSLVCVIPSFSYY